MAQMLPLLLVSLLPFYISAAAVRIGLTHVDSKLNLTEPELLHRAIHRTKHRIASLTPTKSTTDIRSPVKFSTGAYQMEFAIGTPPVPTTAIMDSGGSLIWTQCQLCIQCFNQSTQIYSPKTSTTFSNLASAAPL